MSKLENSDDEFDIREEITVEQLAKDEITQEEEQQKVIDHIKECQKKILDNIPNINKEILNNDFNNYKRDFWGSYI